MGQNEIKNVKQGQAAQSVAPASVPDSPPVLAGVNDDLKKTVFRILERLAVVEAKTAYLPIAKPISMPQVENNNTDFVAGI